MHEEILDIAPLNEIIPENIPFQEAENPIIIGPTRELTAEEQKKIYNWVMNASKEDTVQEEMITKFHGRRNLFLLRMEFRHLKPHEWIGSNDTLLNDRNLIAYQSRGEYIEMNPNLGLDKDDFDKEKATRRQWGKIVKDMLKIVFPT
ncbi:hypothetical protein PIB30_010050 [Stylosanthes scabra]|uniref:Uncharacterized protein n=1 Tax=Stylosanthes scabra TaxID=79078 RepID=A0ABU6W3E1_9FABA|nr:hypothetical protein [Stylosanthes scabra]